MTSSDTPNGRSLASNYVDASYVDHPNPEYHGNPLISTLPHYLSDAELMGDLETLPEFDEREREHAAAVRMTYIGRLSRCFIALPRTVALARALLNLMFEGYVGREPFLPAHRLVLQRLYEAKKMGIKLQDLPPKHRKGRKAGAELSTAFIGASGCGKTTTMKKISSLFPPAIRHNDMWQVPLLIFELPPDGRTLHGLATAIIDALDAALPFAGYAQTYLRKINSRNATERIYDAARLIRTHGVGLLIADESQKQKPSAKEMRLKEDPTKTTKKQLASDHETPLISLLISASNNLGVPLVLVGTNELHDVLDGRMSKLRRAVGHGTEYWGFLERSGNVRKPDEFEALLRKIWYYQWVRKPVKLSDDRAALFFELTQGNPDVMVKLFASAQRRAIRDEVEELTEHIIRETYRLELRPLHRPLKAHEQQDPEALVNYLDIAPVELRAGPNFSKVASEMHEKNLKRERKRIADERRRARDEVPPKPGQLSDGVAPENLADTLKGTLPDDGKARDRLVESGLLATKHDAV